MARGTVSREGYRIMGYIQKEANTTVSLWKSIYCTYDSVYCSYNGCQKSGNLYNQRRWKINDNVHTVFFCREKVFKIVPVQVPTKLQMWQNYLASFFVITYVLQAMWPCVVHILIIDHRPRLSMRVPRVWPLMSSRGGRGKWGLDSRSGRAKN
jgi:hypothetical protein